MTETTNTAERTEQEKALSQANDAAADPRLIDISHIITEDDEPVDNLPSEKQQRMLADALNSSWDGGAHQRKFLVAANVGVFYDPNLPPIVPDVFLSMDVELAENWWEKRHRSYFLWEFGKPPEVAIEVVSNREGGEADAKLAIYARMGVTYYVIFDPLRLLSREVLRIYRLEEGVYQPSDQAWFAELDLGLRLWHGSYEGKRTQWLRWCDQAGRLIPTGRELANKAQRQARQARHQADQARHQAEQADRRATAAQQQAAQESAARLALEAEMARMRAELARLQGDQSISE